MNRCRQQAHELAEAMDRAVLSDGAPCHSDSQQEDCKKSTNAIEMTPTPAVLLSKLIPVAENKGVTVADCNARW